MPSDPLHFAETIAREAGALLLDRFSRLDPGGIRFKGEIDLVTQADLDSERLIVSALRKTFPGHTIGAEEEVRDEIGPDHWLVDPLDGTTNFAHSLPIFAVSMAYQKEGILEAAVVHAPYLGETFTAQRGRGAAMNGREIRVSTRDDLRRSILATGFCYDRRTVADNNLETFSRFVLDVQGMRRMGSASVDLCYVACGRLDGYWEPHLLPHDMAAGALIVEEAGGRVTDYRGGRSYLSMGRIVASNGRLHERILERLPPVAIE